MSSTLGRLRLKNCHKFEAFLGYRVRACLKQRNALKQNKKQYINMLYPIVPLLITCINLNWRLKLSNYKSCH